MTLKDCGTTFHAECAPGSKTDMPSLCCRRGTHVTETLYALFYRLQYLIRRGDATSG
jgi:hypothetical protein